MIQCFHPTFTTSPLCETFCETFCDTFCDTICDTICDKKNSILWHFLWLFQLGIVWSRRLCIIFSAKQLLSSTLILTFTHSHNNCTNLISHVRPFLTFCMVAVSGDSYTWRMWATAPNPPPPPHCGCKTEAQGVENQEGVPLNNPSQTCTDRMSHELRFDYDYDL